MMRLDEQASIEKKSKDSDLKALFVKFGRSGLSGAIVVAKDVDVPSEFLSMLSHPVVRLIDLSNCSGSEVFGKNKTILAVLSKVANSFHPSNDSNIFMDTNPSVQISLSEKQQDTNAKQKLEKKLVASEQRLFSHHLKQQAKHQHVPHQPSPSHFKAKHR